MTRGRGLREVVLSPDEKHILERYARRHSTPQGLAMRARIVLLAASGASNKDVAAALRTSRLTVSKWRTRFLDARMNGLADRARSGAPRRLRDDDLERIISMTLMSRPPGAERWSTRSLARATGFAHTTVSRIWRAFALTPKRNGLARAREADPGDSIPQADDLP